MPSTDIAFNYFFPEFWLCIEKLFPRQIRIYLYALESIWRILEAWRPSGNICAISLFRKSCNTCFQINIPKCDCEKRNHQVTEWRKCLHKTRIINVWQATLSVWNAFSDVYTSNMLHWFINNQLIKNKIVIFTKGQVLLALSDYK